jgi:hypothetical protein
MNSSGLNGQYEVLSPWAEVEPKPLRGLKARVTDLAGKKLGLFCNSKRVARPVLTALEDKLKERFPTCETSWYFFSKVNVPEIETDNKGKFEEWVKGVDAVVTAFGD